MDVDDLQLHFVRYGVVPTIGGGEPRGGEYTGIKGLMLAVLEDALRSFQHRLPRVRAEAQAWVRSNRRFPFSFPVICETLGLEPEAVRAALPRMQDLPASRRRVHHTRRLVHRRRRAAVGRAPRRPAALASGRSPDANASA